MDILNFFGFWGVIILVGIFIAYLIFIDREQTKARLWGWLAETNNLTYIPGSFIGQGGRVTGLYRNCQLRLETIRKSHGKSSHTYTRLTLSRNSLSQQNILPDETMLRRLISAGDAKNLLTSGNALCVSRGRLEIEANGRAITFEQHGFEKDTYLLQNIFDLLGDVIDNYPKVLALGGQAVVALQKMVEHRGSPLRPVAIKLIEDISWQTTARLSQQAQHLFCPSCLLCCSAHQTRLNWWKTVTYYGCRACQQSHSLLQGWLIAVLDSRMGTDYTEREGIVRVNWLARRKLFDFDEVHIVRATDEEVERFAVQVGNDTDSRRRARYVQLPCTVSAECQLSINTMRILERTFGQVTVLEQVKSGGI